MKKKIVGIAFVLLSILIMSVSAFVYISDSQTVTQTVRKVVSTFTLKDPTLTSLFEGETASYTETQVPDLGDAISIQTAKDNVYLYLDSDIDALAGSYSTYTLTVKYASVEGSAHTPGDIAAVLDLSYPDLTAPGSGIKLDVAGTWSFDFELTITAGSVPSDQTNVVTIIVSAADA
jgi:hypothetical protein